MRKNEGTEKKKERRKTSTKISKEIKKWIRNEQINEDHLQGKRKEIWKEWKYWKNKKGWQEDWIKKATIKGDVRKKEFENKEKWYEN